MLVRVDEKRGKHHPIKSQYEEFFRKLSKTSVQRTSGFLFIAQKTLVAPVTWVELSKLSKWLDKCHPRKQNEFQVHCVAKPPIRHRRWTSVVGLGSCIDISQRDDIERCVEKRSRSQSAQMMRAHRCLTWRTLWVFLRTTDQKSFDTHDEVVKDVLTWRKHELFLRTTDRAIL